MATMQIIIIIFYFKEDRNLLLQNVRGQLF